MPVLLGHAQDVGDIPSHSEVVGPRSSFICRTLLHLGRAYTKHEQPFSGGWHRSQSLGRLHCNDGRHQSQSGRKLLREFGLGSHIPLGLRPWDRERFHLQRILWRPWLTSRVMTGVMPENRTCYGLQSKTSWRVRET